MRKTIPEEVHIYCDRCGHRCQMSTNFKRATSIKINRGEPDHMWEYHSHTIEFDLCDECSDETVDFIRGDK